MKLNVGIIGYGMAGEVFHAPIINSLDELNLAKIVSSRAETIEAVKKRYPQTKVVLSLKDLLEDDTIDLIVVATPNTSHYDLTKRVLMSGKHVIVEKPFTITSRDADELIGLAKEKEKILTVHQNRRWDSDFLTVKRIIENNVLGNVVEYEAHFDRFKNKVKSYSWREEDIPGSGMLYDLGSHLIDQALILFGLPREVFGDIRIQRKDGKVDDYFEIILYYNNLKVILKSSMLVREPLPHFIVLGDKGSFIKYGMDGQEANLKEGRSPLDFEPWGVEPIELWGTINTDINGLHYVGKVESIRGDYRCFYKNVYNAIIGKEELVVRAEEARNVIKIIELVIQSSKEKRVIKYT